MQYFGLVIGLCVRADGGLVKVHAIIVNYNSSRFIERCIASLDGEAVDSITVVDNASSPADSASLVEMVGAHAGATVHKLDRNIGFGGGVNFGVSMISRFADPTDLLWVLNPDLWVHPGSKALLAESLASCELVSPIILNDRVGGTELWFEGGDIDVRRGYTQTTRNPSDCSSDGLVPTQFVTGAAPMLRLATFYDIRGFREDLFLYWEDADLSLRLAASGGRLAVNRSAIASHYVGGSSGATTGKSRSYYFYFARNRLLVCGPYAGALNVLLFSGGLVSARIFKRACTEQDDRFSKAAAFLQGSISGLSAAFRQRFLVRPSVTA